MLRCARATARVRCLPRFAYTSMNVTNLAPRPSLAMVRALSATPDEAPQSLPGLLHPSDTFLRRHVGPTAPEVTEMAESMGYRTLDEFVCDVVPNHIRMKQPLDVAPPMAENEALAMMRTVAEQNIVKRSHIGMGYYDTIVPKVILRNVLESPAWYTPYTPYQAEIAQGRLESLLNFQTGVMELTGMDVAGASLLDEATAAAEAMTMAFHIGREKRARFIVAERCHPQTLAVVKTRASFIGVTVEEMSTEALLALRAGDMKDVCGVLVQYPDTVGAVTDFSGLVREVQHAKALSVFATDLLALCQLTPPGELGADIVLGTAQRFGVPMGYGGPHAAFFATRDQYKRSMPGRVIGVSIDSHGDPALRMSLQTREQHIRREKATSNVCTAQALLANMTAFYMLYHGPEGLKQIAQRTHAMASLFAHHAGEVAGVEVAPAPFFDTVHLMLSGTMDSEKLMTSAYAKNINLRRLSDSEVTVAFDETTTVASVTELLGVLHATAGTGLGPTITVFDSVPSQFSVPAALRRSTPILKHPIFSTFNTETDMLRYIYQLQNKDLGLQNAMIPLGSCTMKLNATTEMIPVTWSEFGGLHPFAPRSQAQGYSHMLADLSKDLAEITGFAQVSMQPNSGAQGEYAGLVAITNYHKANGDHQRDVCLIPVSAHGTNPASAIMAGMKVQIVQCDKHGNMDMADFKEKAQKYANNLACLMITYPSTHGVFEETIVEICDIVHEHGGMVYMDGANLNAQLGLCRPGDIGADVCHLNLHKTFCIPHGGGGPGMGPIGVVEALVPHLPSHCVINMDATAGAPDTNPATTDTLSVSAAPWGSASILPISWAYIRLMGGVGLTYATKIAILNANYMANRLKEHYKILYTARNGRVAHEFILDLRPFKVSCGITESDVAKRLLDYSFHAPTMSWPVAGTLMVEPTESESRQELDRFCDALINIREEIRAVEEGRVDKENNVLKNAPHSLKCVTLSAWEYPYTREEAAYPVASLRKNKFWPTVGRLNDVHGDKNFVCSCPPMEDYQ